MTQAPPPPGPPYGEQASTYADEYARWNAEHGQQWAAWQAQQETALREQDRRRQVHPHDEGRLYPQMLRTWSYAWWKPFLGLITFVVAGLLVIPAVMLVVLAIAVAVQGGSGPFAQRVLDAASLGSVTPASMLYLNLTLAALTLLAMLLVRVVHGMRPRWLSSVRPGMRWKFFAVCLGLSVVALVISFAVGSFLPGDTSGATGTAHVPTGQLLATAVVILLTTPLQALGEEYGFRGYLMQAVGSLVDGIATGLGASRRTAERIACGLALVVTAGLFALAHGTQNFPLFFDRFAFGLMAGLVVILVGGLEAGIALHILNNLLAFGVAIAYDQLDSTLTVSSASWWQLPVTVVQNGVYLLLVLWVARRMGLSRRTTPPVAEGQPRLVGEQPFV